MRKSIIKTCKWCGKKFTTTNRDKKACCKECGIQLRIHSSKYLTTRGSKRKYNVNDYFFEQDTPSKYYILGLLAADGIVTKEGYIKLWQCDKLGLGLELIDWYKNILNLEAPIKTVQPKKGKLQYGIQFTSSIIAKTLKENNIVNNKTFTVTIPNYILEDETKLRYYLIGYIDGDGYVGVYKTSSGYYNLEVSFISNNLFTSKLLPYIKTNSMFVRANKNNINVTSMSCGGTSAILFCEWLYKDLDNNIFKSFKTQKVINYLNNLDTLLNPKTYQKYECRKLITYFNNHPPDNKKLIEISKHFNIKLNRVKYVYKRWKNKYEKNK